MWVGVHMCVRVGHLGSRGSSSQQLWSVSQEILFYKVIDYILHGKEDIKVIP